MENFVVKMRVSRRAVLIGLLILVAAPTLGFFVWLHADPPVLAGTKLYAFPTTPSPNIQLYDATAIEIDPGTIRCEVRYRFRDGTPAAGSSWYCFMMEFPGSPGSYRMPIESQDLQLEGMLLQDIRLIRPGAVKFQISLADAQAKEGPYRPVSNTVSGILDKALPQVKDFSLPGTDGKQHSLTEWKDQKAVVLIFLGTECPVSNSYAPEYTRLEKAFRETGVRFFGVHPDPDVTAQAAADHAKEYHLTFSILLDPTQVLAKQTGVAVTPEAVVLSPKGQVLYRGRIDDRYQLDGKRKDEAQTKDLEAALAAVVAGKTPPTRETKAYGCPLPPPGQ
jgi:peroxiredoxin